MPAVLASRVNYHERQFIRLAEMCDEQAYHRQLHRRHNLTHHAWGIVAGLELVVNDGLPQVRITGAQGSGILRSMSEANCMVVLEEAQGNVAAGDLVSVMPFDGLV